MSARRIEDYALIGDCETAALVGRDGSIDWLCWPRFDSAACFAAILGTPDNGRWLLAPKDDGAKVTRRYWPGTLILETRFETATGSVLLIDFMPPRGECSDIVRVVRGERGSVEIRTEFALRFDYGRTIPWVARLDDGTWRAIAGPDMVTIRSPVETHGEGMTSVAEFTVREGESVPFVMTYRPSHQKIPEPVDPEQALTDTEQFWTEWSSRYRSAADDKTVVLPDGLREAGERSLITLKALTYAPTGGIVAAPTTSLPEWIGGPRNWDYRYCWLRDSAITLFALMDAGYFDEAQAWRDWLVRAIAGSADQMQIMYGIAGERQLVEWEIGWLDGFEGSRPVRIGNAASDQVQIDTYGEVMSLLHQARMGGIPESPQAWSMQKAILAHLETMWREPDAGMWEMRGPPRHHTFSKVMAWVAFDRALKSAEKFGLDDAPLDRWRELRDEIHADILQKGFDETRGTFTQFYGSEALDASLLLIPTLGFLPDDDPRIRSTVEAVERDLMVDGLVLRYRTDGETDGLPGGEGAFLACSFWLVVALIEIGRIDDATALLTRLLALRNDLGLLAEEYDPVGKRQLGNFPQAFSHVALLHAGHRLVEALEGEGKAATSEAFQEG